MQDASDSDNLKSVTAQSIADLGGGGGVSTDAYNLASLGTDSLVYVGSKDKGLWASATAYAVGDSVLRRGKRYFALLASTGSYPESAPTLTSVNVKQTNSGTEYGSGGTATGTSVAMRFAPTSNVSVNAIQVNRTAAGTLKIGIASALGADSSAVTWLAKVDAAPVVVGNNVITLPSTLDLVSGTTYYIVAVTTDGTTDVYRFGTSGGSGGTYTGATSGAKATGSSSSWGGFSTTYEPAFDMGSTDPAWQVGVTVSDVTAIEKSGTAAPTTGTWAVGDKVWNSAAAASGTVGWVCTTAGTPGTWKTFGTISA